MSNDPLGRLIGQPRPGAAGPTLVVSIVSRSDSTGVWVTPLGGDTQSPLGPCIYRPLTVLIGDAQQGYRLGESALPVGTKCLVANTTEGPFLVAP